MWIFNDKCIFPPVFRHYLEAAGHYRQGWLAALTALRDAVKPEAVLPEAVFAAIWTLLAQHAEPGDRDPSQELSRA